MVHSGSLANCSCPSRRQHINTSKNMPCSTFPPALQHLLLFLSPLFSQMLHKNSQMSISHRTQNACSVDLRHHLYGMLHWFHSCMVYNWRVPLSPFKCPLRTSEAESEQGLPRGQRNGVHHPPAVSIPHRSLLHLGSTGDLSTHINVGDFLEKIINQAVHYHRESPWSPRIRMRG